MKRTLLALSFILLSTRLFASHIAGGDVRYEFNGVNYTVYVTLTGDCSPTSIPFGGTLPVNFASTSTSQSFMRQFAMTTVDYPAQSCTSNPCSPSAILPGYAMARFVDTVTLPPATDWVISLPPANSRTTPVNLSSFSNPSFYVEATLNNSTSPNSSPRLADWPTVYIGNGFSTYFPLNNTDIDGDSIAYELVDPLVDASTTTQYAVGYSNVSPLGSGGIYQLTANNTNILVKGNLLGAHALALKAKEYRNKVLIASFMREFTVSITNLFTSQQTIPVCAASSVLDIYTCPGQNNNITVNFIDSTASDSVFVTAQTPTMSGWIFNVASNAAPGIGSATISWTTPASANPSTLRQFVIKLTARDNNCPLRSIVEQYITVRLQLCSADSVWPGDADGDNTVNLYDPLYIAIANGKTGAPRTGAVTTWTPQYCAPWSTNFLTNNANMKHADCDGNGVVNTGDLSAVANNYGQFHLKGGDQEKTTGVPELYFDLNGVVLLPGAPASIPIRVGNAASVINNLYGLASRIRFDGVNPASSPTINTTTSWIGNGSSTLNFTYPISNTTVDWAHARIDQMEVAGHGVAGVLNFTVPVTAIQGQTVNLSFELSRLINKDGHDIPFNAVNASLKVGFPNNVAEIYTGSGAFVVPNPSGNTASLHLTAAQAGVLNLSIINMVGQNIWEAHYNIAAGDHSFALPTDMAPGLYSIRLNNQASTRTIKWAKQQ